MAKVQGASRLERKLRAFPQSVKEQVKSAVVQSAEEVVGAQRALAPKRTGKLAKSIVYSMGNESPPKYASLKGGGNGRGDPELTAIITAGNSEVRYAHLVEWGSAPHPQGGQFEGTDHPGTQPKPFFYPGYRLTRKKAKGRVSRAVNKAAKKAAAG
jgi:HK97 gp10 family phage protein